MVGAFEEVAVGALVGVLLTGADVVGFDEVPVIDVLGSAVGGRVDDAGGKELIEVESVNALWNRSTTKYIETQCNDGL